MESKKTALRAWAFERIKARGAVVVRAPYEMGGGWIATLADPEGNYFQRVNSMPQ